MSDAVGDLENTGSPISRSLYFALSFAGVGIAFLFLTFRLSVRWLLFKKWFWDDGLVIFAWCIQLAAAAAGWVERDGMYSLWYLVNNILPLKQSNIDLAIGQLRLMVATMLLFTTCLWSIKLSFLIFFRRLGGVQQYQGRWWWIVTTFTALTYCSLFAAMPYECTSSDVAKLTEKCGSNKAAHKQRILFYYHLAADIATDILIASIPVIMLWNVRMPRKQKLGLMVLFCLTVIVVVVAIIRLVVTVKKVGHTNTDPTWVAFWGALEVTLAIIIACCCAFRQFFKMSGPNQVCSSAFKSTGYSGKHSLLSNWRTKIQNSKRGHGVSAGSRYGNASLRNRYDSERGIPDDSKQILVSREVEISNTDISLRQIDQAYFPDNPFTTGEQFDRIEHKHSKALY